MPYITLPTGLGLPITPPASPLTHIRRCDSDGLTTASTQFIDDMEDQDTVVDRWAVVPVTVVPGNGMLVIVV